jgi:hypothetical protein
MTFHELHDAGEPLLLPNAWDVPSALAFLGAGFAAIGTTSFGVASSLGRPDGGRATRDANLALARALSSLPAYVSVDIEDGYDDDPEQVATYVAELAAAGAAGINIEDSSAEKLIDPRRTPRRWRRSRSAARACSSTLVWTPTGSARRPRRRPRSPVPPAMYGPARMGCSSLVRRSPPCCARSARASRFR